MDQNIFCPFSTISPILKLSRAFKIEGNLFASENIEIKQSPWFSNQDKIPISQKINTFTSFYLSLSLAMFCQTLNYSEHTFHSYLLISPFLQVKTDQ